MSINKEICSLCGVVPFHEFGTKFLSTKSEKYVSYPGDLTCVYLPDNSVKGFHLYKNIRERTREYFNHKLI